MSTPSQQRWVLTGFASALTMTHHGCRRGHRLHRDQRTATGGGATGTNPDGTFVPASDDDSREADGAGAFDGVAEAAVTVPFQGLPGQPDGNVTIRSRVEQDSFIAGGGEGGLIT